MKDKSFYYLKEYFKTVINCIITNIELIKGICKVLSDAVNKFRILFIRLSLHLRSCFRCQRDTKLILVNPCCVNAAKCL